MKRITAAMIMGIAVLFMFGPSAQCATTWYVSRIGANSSGTTWATAWNECNQINWNVVQPGDTIILDEGTYNTPLFTSRDGVTIRRTTETGHSGFLYMNAQIKLWNRNTVLDGLDATRFIITPTDSMCGLFVGYWSPEASGTIVRNVTLNGTYATVSGVSMSVYAPDCVVDSVVFNKSAGEDMLAIMTNGNCTVKNCVFKNHVGAGTTATHRDCISVYPGIAPGKVLTLTGNQFLNNKTDNLGVFPNAGAVLGGFDIRANTFKDGNTAIHFDDRLTSANFIRVTDNWYWNMGSFIVNNSPVSITQSGNKNVDPYHPTPTPVPTMTPTPLVYVVSPGVYTMTVTTSGLTIRK